MATQKVSHNQAMAGRAAFPAGYLGHTLFMNRLLEKFDQLLFPEK
jgi:hypothetical protein